MLEKLYYYQADYIRTIDGDTIQFLLDRGFGDHSIKTIRLNRINCAEIRGINKDLGVLAQNFVEKQFSLNPKIIIKSEKLDPFGRAIGEIWLSTDGFDQFLNLGDMLLDKGLAELKQY